MFSRYFQRTISTSCSLANYFLRTVSLNRNTDMNMWIFFFFFKVVELLHNLSTFPPATAEALRSGITGVQHLSHTSRSEPDPIRVGSRQQSLRGDIWSQTGSLYADSASPCVRRVQPCVCVDAGARRHHDGGVFAPEAASAIWNGLIVLVCCTTMQINHCT